MTSGGCLQKMNSKTYLFLVFVIGGLLSGCVGATSEATRTQTSEVYLIEVQSVTVSPGNEIRLTGMTTLPDGNCVYSQLSCNGAAVAWWPVGKCFPISTSDWQFSIPLGEEGAPNDLDREADYLVRVWWPGAPSVTQAEFPFDITALLVP